MQFSRYLSLVKRRGGEVLFEVPRRLLRLFEGLDGVDKMIPYDEATKTPSDFVIHLMSLPGLFTSSEETIPSTVPYLHPETRLVEETTAWISKGSFAVGISWSGSKENAANPFRSIPLEEFNALSSMDGVQLYSLQKGDGKEQLAAITVSSRIVDLGDRCDNGADGFVETAAVLTQLDLIISVDSSLVHLAGALARPVWTILSSKPEWRWFKGRSDSPWYPTMRLFRASPDEAWSGVMTRVAVALKDEKSRRKGNR